MDYTMGTVWTDGAELTATDLVNEFLRIQAVLNGGLEVTNFVAGEIAKASFINAGDPRFQTGGLDDAEIVAAAVAEAVAGDIKWVFIPRTLFGYASAASFAPAIFSTAVAMIREGQALPGQDPIAYGAKPDDALVDDKPSFQAAMDAAAAAGIGGNPGSAHVCVQMPGDYLLNTDATLAVGVGYEEFPGVTTSGAGAIKSASAGTDKAGVHPFKGLVHQIVTAAPGLVNILASASNTGSANVGLDMADWMLMLIELQVDQDTGANVVKNSGLAQMVVANTNGNTVIDFVQDNGGATLVQWTTTNTDGGSAHDFDVSLVMYFVKKEAL